MNDVYYADFHIHIGRSQGRPVKMAAAPSLTLFNLLDHAKNRKGLHIVTVIDGVCHGVQMDVQKMINEGTLTPVVGGGYLYENQLLVILGSEIEIAGPHGGAAHFGCWFSDLDSAHDFSLWLKTVQKNISLSSQMAYTDARTLQHEVKERSGMFIIHHAFTPHKGIYGNCVNHLSDMVDTTQIDAVELGLSADTEMADCLQELQHFPFITNSDAHSLGKIAREYNALRLRHLSFEQVRFALHSIEQNRIIANYGLLPTLGKYHRSFCINCERTWTIGETYCNACGSSKYVPGVYDRLLEIRDYSIPIHPVNRPPYIHQVPLEFIPGIGPKTLNKLLQTFGSEMTVLHQATLEALMSVVGETLAHKIIMARSGSLQVQEGGGGLYGKVLS